MITTITVMLVVLLFSLVQAHVYEAKATCMVSAATTSEHEYTAIQIIEQLLQTISKIAVSRPVLEDAARKLDIRVGATKLQDDVNSEVLTNTQLIEISARDTRPTNAMLKANAVADSLIAFFEKKRNKNSVFRIEKIEAARKPNAPISPRPLRNTIIGGFLGLILGFACAALLEFIYG